MLNIAPSQGAKSVLPTASYIAKASLSLEGIKGPGEISSARGQGAKRERVFNINRLIEEFWWSIRTTGDRRK